jgi:methionine S-methyltransferase
MEKESFLSKCSISSQETYDNFRQILNKLDDHSVRTSTIAFVHELANFLIQKHTTQEMIQLYHFAFSHLTLTQQDGKTTEMILLQLPSTFAPEEWSFTFFEGLARCRASEFQDKLVVELGCGIGWISIALAKQTKPEKIYGLDLNPRAVLCSKINLYLNAFEKNGNPSWIHEGKTLLERIEFHTSDLLEYCRNKALMIDRIIGCIPQVLNPDPEFASHFLHKSETKLYANTGATSSPPGLPTGFEGANDDFLYSLSNYTTDQGYLEDQFGLGLIARAAEEAAEVLKISGKLILNLGGRPGTQVLSGLFQRRGYKIRPIWRTQVSQAKDTDIQSLVAIEEKTAHRFEFYLSHEGEIPISAKTAHAYATAGGEIVHGLTVYECQLRDPVHLPKILNFIRENQSNESANSLDLSFSDDSLALEKTAFLDGLIEQFKAPDTIFAYDKTAGTRKFRKNISSFFQQYYQLPIHENNVIVLPARHTACESILQIYRPQTALVDTGLSHLIGYRPEVIEIPKNSDLLCALMTKLHPQIVIYSMSTEEAQTRESFVKICQTALEANSRLFIDISELLDLSSSPASYGIFRHLSKNPLPAHVSLLCGLVKNRIYRDLEVCFMISQNRNVLEHLEHAAELTYSRTPLVSQIYYDKIIQELINFQITETQKRAESVDQPLLSETPKFQSDFIAPSSHTLRAFSHPAIATEHLARNDQLIRLDYGENCLPAPKALQNALFEAFAKMNLTQEDCDCSFEIRQLVSSRLLLPKSEECRVILGSGVAILFAQIARHCAQQSYTLMFPSGSYGHFTAAAMLYGTAVASIPTLKANSFKLEPAQLAESLRLHQKLKPDQPAWIMISAPIVNPTGAVYSPQELESLFEVIEKYQGVLIIDSIFSGLEFSESSQNAVVNLTRYPKLRWIILGGISKQFAAGGLRIGYGVSNDLEISSLFRLVQPYTPHPTLRFTLKKLYQNLIDRNSELIRELQKQNLELKQRADLLSNTLRNHGWDPLPTQGGLFLSATPIRPIKADSMADQYRKTIGVVINPPSWTGIPEYFRFVISTSSQQFEEALRRIELKSNLLIKETL